MELGRRLVRTANHIRVLCFFSWGGEGLSSIFLDNVTLTSVESNRPDHILFTVRYLPEAKGHKIQP